VTLADGTGTTVAFDLAKALFAFEGETISKIVAGFHQGLKDRGIPGSRVRLITANCHAPEAYPAWRRDLDYRIRVLGWDFHLFEHFRELQQFSYLDQRYDAHLDEIRTDLEARRLRPKHYLCLNRSPKWHRWAIVLHLADRGWLDQGDVS